MHVQYICCLYVSTIQYYNTITIIFITVYSQNLTTSLYFSLLVDTDFSPNDHARWCGSGGNAAERQPPGICRDQRHIVSSRIESTELQDQGIISYNIELQSG